MHFVKVRGPETAQRVGPCTGKPLPRRRISRIVCDGGLSGCESMRLQVQRTEPVLCANLREDLLQRDHPERPSHEAWFRRLRSRMGRRPPSFLGTRKEVTAVKAWLAQSWRNHFYGLFPAASSPLSAERERSRLHRGGDHAAEAGVFERIGVNNLVLLSPSPTLTLRGWPARPRPAWQGVG